MTVAVNATVAPTATDAVGGATVTLVRTGGAAVTAMLAVPVFPDDAALMVAEPAATPLTTPLELTVAAAELFDDHVTVWPVITFPDWSLTVAANGCAAPTSRDAMDGETPTLVTTGTGGGSVVTLVPPLEHTTSCGTRTSQAQLRVMRLIDGIIFCTRRVSFGQGDLLWSARQQNAAAAPTTYIGFAGGSAGMARFRYSPVALRHHLSTVLL